MQVKEKCESKKYKAVLAGDNFKNQHLRKNYGLPC